MSAIRLYSNLYITVEFDPVKKQVQHTVHQPVGEDQVEIFKEAMNAGSKALEEHGACKWLSDDRKNGPLPQELVEWGDRDWNRRTIKAGWKYWANVVPAEIHAAGSLTPVINYLYELGLRMRVFTSVEDAQAWLDSVQ